MKAVNVIRKIFLTLACLAVVGGIGFLAYLMEPKDFGENFQQLMKLLVIPAGVWLFGIILAESTTSGAHKVGLAIHVSMTVTLAITLWICFNTYGAAAQAEGATQLDLMKLLAIYVMIGGLGSYLISFIFHAASTGYRKKQENVQVFLKNAPAPESNNSVSDYDEEIHEEYIEEPQYQQLPPQQQYPIIQQFMNGQPASNDEKQEKREENLPEDDVHVATLMKWKKLYVEGIITEREFLEQREAVLKLRQQEKAKAAAKNK